MYVNQSFIKRTLFKIDKFLIYQFIVKYIYCKYACFNVFNKVWVFFLLCIYFIKINIFSSLGNRHIWVHIASPVSVLPN